MARVHSILGYINGKAQNTVFAQQKGQTTLRAYQPNVSNPSTEKQRSNRDVLAWLLIVANFLNFPVLVPYLNPKKRKQSPINSFTSQLGRIITAIAINEAVIRSEVITNHLNNLNNSNLSVANGPKSFNLTNYTTLTASTTTSTTAELDMWRWTNANLSPADRQDDNLVIVAVNITNPQPPEVSVSPDTRASPSSSYEFNLPPRSATDIILIFAFMYNSTDGETSKGLVYGTLTGTTWARTTARTFVG
jgi:hypothetical protein